MLHRAVPSPLSCCLPGKQGRVLRRHDWLCCPVPHRRSRWTPLLLAVSCSLDGFRNGPQVWANPGFLASFRSLFGQYSSSILYISSATSSKSSSSHGP
jgi:hypothetical protein